MRATAATEIKTTFLLFMGTALFTGCVSVSLGGGSGGSKRAEGVHLREPGKPFGKEPRTDVDGAWKNEANGNLISYLSDCQDSTDPSLDSIVQGATMGLSDLHVESSDSPTIQDREARRVVATGKVDGVPSKIDLLAFKRNRCIYILTYVGVLKAFDQDHAHFDRFIQGFRAP
jgi:hypothetical protein